LDDNLYNWIKNQIITVKYNKYSNIFKEEVVITSLIEQSAEQVTLEITSDLNDRMLEVEANIDGIETDIFNLNGEITTIKFNAG
jgi:hypothetical protein